MGGKREAGETKSPSKGTESGDLSSGLTPKPVLLTMSSNCFQRKSQSPNLYCSLWVSSKKKKKKKERKKEKKKKNTRLHGDAGSIPGREDPLQKEMAIPHSSFLAWETSRTEEPGGLQSMGSQKSDMTYD